MANWLRIHRSKIIVIVVVVALFVALVGYLIFHEVGRSIRNYYFQWQGNYSFSEFAPGMPGSNETWGYGLAIAPDSQGKLRLKLDIDGFQTMMRINAVASSTGEVLDAVFDSYGSDNFPPNQFLENPLHPGDVLFTLRPQNPDSPDTNLKIEWKKLQPMLSENLQGSVFEIQHAK